ncbi:MAG: zinc-dependent metalloprotease, partial [Bdellovibrionota bacterium]
ETFQAALGRTDDIVVLDESAEANISDPTQNVIAYYPSATSMGLLGVAQTVTDPRTGEVVAARSTVFEDGIQGTLGWVDDTIELLASENPIADVVKTDALKGTPTKFKSPFTGAKFGEHVKLMNGVLGMKKIKTQSGVAKNPMAIVNESRKSFAASADKATIRMANLAAKAPSLFAVQDLANFQAPFETKTNNKLKLAATSAEAPFLGGMESLVFGFEKVREDKKRVMEFAEKGIHGAELVEDAAARYLMKLLQKQTPQQMKAAKEQIKEEIAKQTFYTTLLHEMGHNFGLRHNFAGSADADNFTDQHKALKAKMATDKTITPDDLLPFAFSSIMDYGGDFYSQIGGLGPYDKAAIKYAYNRGVNRDQVAVRKENGRTIPYKFCTDHQVDEEITCRRFDKGTNVSEITLELTNTFNRNWPLSHFRRDRYTFGRNMGATMGRMLMNTMVPVRQVMDEFIYSFIAAEKIDAATKAKAKPETTTGLCEMKFVHVSVVKGEIANICSPLAMEQAGVDPTDLESLYNALINPATGGLFKQPSEYVPYGMADLLFANLTAQEFFQSVIGATEPGTYLALPPQAQGQPFSLIKLDQDQPTDEDKLKAFAEENGIPNPDNFVKQAKNLLTDVKIGGSGRPFSSTASSTAGFTRTESIGSFWDKYAAILALGFRDIGIMKYSEKSMNGNAYVFPQSKKFATALFNNLITGNPAITLIPVELRMKNPQGQGIVGPAVAQASLNTDTQALSTFVGFGLFASDLDASFVDKLRVCNKNEGQCSEGAGGEVVEFKSAGGGDVFRAAQTATGDSIAFSLVKDAKAISDEREKWTGIGKKAGELQADNLLRLDAAGDLRARIDENLAKIPELKIVRDQITNLDPEAQTAWSMLVMLTEQIDKAPLFLTLDLAQKIGGAFQGAGALVDAEIEKMGAKGICEAAPAPGEVTEPGDGIPGILLGEDSAEMKALTMARANGKFGNMSAVLANMTPPPPPNTPATPVANDECEKSPDAQRRATLVALKTDFTEVTTLVGAVLEANVNQKAAPLQVRRLTDEIASKEGFIRLVRTLSQQSGGL